MSESTLTIRRTKSDDWSALRAIRIEALLDTPEAFGSTYAETMLYSDDEWRSFASKRCYFLAERDGVVVGMISGGFNDAQPGTHWLYGMFVTPLDRGTGTAQALVRSVSEWARGDGAEELFLQVGSSVARARAFYEKLGFVPTGDQFALRRDATLVLLTMKRSLVES
ncbi:MAG TPA: GNAT family N-acetyltransferase [Acidimicrobiales bacterium]